jgi:hypothetical protein
VDSHLLNLRPTRKEGANHDGSREGSWGRAGNDWRRLRVVAIFR